METILETNMETNMETTNWQINYDYVETQLNNLVRTGNVYKFALYDEYGNKTKYFSINSEQLEKIGNVLKNI